MVVWLWIPPPRNFFFRKSQNCWEHFEIKDAKRCILMPMFLKLELLRNFKPRLLNGAFCRNKKQLICTVKSIKMCPKNITCRPAGVARVSVEPPMINNENTTSSDISSENWINEFYLCKVNSLMIIYQFETRPSRHFTDPLIGLVTCLFESPISKQLIQGKSKNNVFICIKNSLNLYNCRFILSLHNQCRERWKSFKGETGLYKPVGGAGASFCMILNILNIRDPFYQLLCDWELQLNLSIIFLKVQHIT